MDNDQFVLNLLTIAFPAIALLANWLLSRKIDDELNNLVEICKDLIISKINRHLKFISTHYQNEINRVLVATTIKGVNDIRVKDVKEVDYSIKKEQYEYLVKTNNYLKKLTFLDKSMDFLRISLFGITTIAALILILFLFNLATLEWLNYSILLAGIILFLLVFGLLVFTTPYIKKVKKHYALQK